jgi:prepilin peptidase CpaA
VQNATTTTLLAILVLAVLKDTRAHRIPNALTAVGICAGLLLQALAGGAPALLMGLAGLAVGIVTLLPFYIMRGMGAGDVKLMGAVGAFMGPNAVFIAAAATLVLGAVLGLGILAGRLLSHSGLWPKRALLPLHVQPSAPHSIRKEKFPYAIAIAGGSAVSLSHFGQLDALADFIFTWTGL